MIFDPDILSKDIEEKVMLKQYVNLSVIPRSALYEDYFLKYMGVPIEEILRRISETPVDVNDIHPKVEDKYITEKRKELHKQIIEHVLPEHDAQGERINITRTQENDIHVEGKSWRCDIRLYPRINDWTFIFNTQKQRNIVIIEMIDKIESIENPMIH